MAVVLAAVVYACMEYLNTVMVYTCGNN